jgi:hypothetical protein
VIAQKRIFDYLIKQGKKTKFWKDHGFDNIHDVQDFQAFVPIRSYEGIFTPYIQYALEWMHDVLWPWKIPSFGVTGWTTQDKNKFVPLTKEFMRNNQFTSSKGVLTHYVINTPESWVLTGKILNVPGVLWDENRHGKWIAVGNQSAIYTSQIPTFAQKFSFPSHAASLLPFEEHVNNYQLY